MTAPQNPVNTPGQPSPKASRQAHAEEKSFLSGPRERWRELAYTFGVFRQFIRGFRALHFAGPCVTIFGSARFKEGHPYYELARKVATGLAQSGFTIMTGGGPGIMEAANRGAREGGGLSIGCNIVLPREQSPNPYLDRFVSIEYFFVRKELLRKYSSAFIVMPGGYGTLDEFFETLTLVQTGKTEAFPIIIMGLEFHKDLIAHFERMKQLETISPDDLKYILLTDSVEEAQAHILEFAETRMHRDAASREPIRLLGEKKIKKTA